MMSPTEADALAAALLGDLRTKLGGPHIAHARRVAAMVMDSGDDSVIAAALLHDVVEKGRVTSDELRALTGDPSVVDLVEVLTKHASESEREYLARCAAHPVACFIKRMDLADKLITDDWTVSGDVADELRREATERIEMLRRFANGHAR